MSAEITEEKDVMSGPEAEEFIEELKKVFSIVRLLDKDNFEHMERHYNEHGEVPCQCYEIWKKKSPCENCISTKTFADGKQRTKLEFIDSKIYQVISRYIEIDGKPYVMELVSQLDENSLVDADGRNRLLKKLVGYNKELYTDVLTGTYNRRYYEEQLKMMREAAGVAMIDLDDFKMYNDTYGHKAGDRVLDTTVQIIRSCIRKSDILVRYGGDEFLLILPDIEEKNFVERLKKIQEEIHKSQIPGYTKLQLSVSIGGVLTDRETVESAVNRADRFMYQAKIQKNMVVTEDGAFQGSNGSFAILNRKRKNHRVLIVDDSEMNRFLLREMIGPEFEILEAENGAECLDMLRRYGTGISLVLLDIVMPVMDGFEVLEKMNKNHWIDDIPVIMISSEDSAAFIRRAYDMGVSDYISRPFDAQVVYRRVMNTIKLYARQRRLINLVTDQVYEKEKNNRMMIGILSEIVEFRNGESGPHVLHINMLTELLLEEPAVSGVTLVTDMNQTILDMLESLDSVIGVLITSAGLLAFVVVYNLNNINITERRRELATIRLLGFYDMELAAYVYRENVLLTAIGIVVGIFMGNLLHRFVIKTVEVDLIMFGRVVHPISYVYCAALTVLFALLVNGFMYFKLRKIDMVESLKSVE